MSDRGSGTLPTNIMKSQTGVAPLVIILVVVVLAIAGVGGYLVLSQQGASPAASPSPRGVPLAEMPPTALPTPAGFPYAGLWEIKQVLIAAGPGKWKESSFESPNRFMEIQPQGQICAKPSPDAPCDPGDTHAARIDGNTLVFPGKIGDTPVTFRFTFTLVGETLEVLVTSDYRDPVARLEPFKILYGRVR